jgi:peptidyl-prolyl cis-trans isomerase SurA
MAAQNYSKAPTAKAGGALGWIPAASLPPAVAPRVLALKVGEVTDPISVPGAVQLFLLRDVSLSEGDALGAAQVDYTQFFAPSGTDLAAVRASLDTCDDLYDAARGLPVEALQRATLPEAGLSPSLRGALAGMDPGETAVLPGVAPSLVMLCARVPQSQIAPSRDDVASTLLNKKLSLIAGAYLTELKSNAFIRFP